MLRLFRCGLFLVLGLGLFGCASKQNEDYVDFEKTQVFCTLGGNENVNIQGLKICPNNRYCSDSELLPYQPCLQPMPKYYEDRDIAEGDVILIHPYTRSIIFCYENEAGDAKKCVTKFKKDGYVLITDVPQLPAKYDRLVEGNYPARRWGANRKQTVPRW